MVRTTGNVGQKGENMGRTRENMGRTGGNVGRTMGMWSGWGEHERMGGTWANEEELGADEGEYEADMGE